MVKSLVGKKLGMTQVFDREGNFIPVTVLQVGPCFVTQLKSPGKDGTDAVQIGFGDRKRKNTPRPLLGHFEACGVSPKRVLKDVKRDGEGEIGLGDEVGVAVFEGVSHVDVIAVDKGRGFAGVIKRHGFHGGPATHGSKVHRHGGSIGPGTSPGRVIKGRKMAGHMGARRVTVRNLQVLRVDPERDLLLVKGSVAGPNGGHVLVSKARTAGAAKD